MMRRNRFIIVFWKVLNYFSKALLPKLVGFGFSVKFQNKIPAKMTRISLQNFCKTLFVLLSLSLASCVRGNNEGSSFRIVGLNGESRQLQTRMPELNARILESQGRQVPQQNTSQAAPQQQQQMQQQAPVAQNQQQFTASPNADFGADTNSSDALKDTMQSDQGKPTYNVAKVQTIAPKKEQQSDSLTSVGAPEEKDPEIQIDLDDSEKVVKKSGKKMKLKSGKSASNKGEDAEEAVVSKDQKKGIFVQTGSFSAEENAKQDLSTVQKFNKGRIEEAEVGHKKIYRVVLGPYPNAAKAKAAVEKIKSAGHDAIVVKNK